MIPIPNPETMAEYQARLALSAGMCWNIINECPAYAWHHSCFNPDAPEVNGKHFDIGTACHLAVLEPEEVKARCALIVAPDYKTKLARELRDEAYGAGLTPLLEKDMDLVQDMRMALQNSDAAPLLFRQSAYAPSYNEVSYGWEWDGTECKARADRILLDRDALTIVDLKTANSANPEAFIKATMRDGHHMRAAWYLDGWPGVVDRKKSKYLFVVVAKNPPHLVSIFKMDNRALDWGRTLYHKAVHEFRRCTERGIWPGYSAAGAEGEKIINISLPAWAEYRLADQEAEGQL